MHKTNKRTVVLLACWAIGLWSTMAAAAPYRFVRGKPTHPYPGIVLPEPDPDAKLPVAITRYAHHDDRAEIVLPLLNDEMICGFGQRFDDSRKQFDPIPVDQQQNQADEFFPGLNLLEDVFGEVFLSGSRQEGAGKKRV